MSLWKFFIILLFTFILYFKWKYYILNETSIHDTDMKLHGKYIKVRKVIEDMDSLLIFGFKSVWRWGNKHIFYICKKMTQYNSVGTTHTVYVQ